MKTGSDIFSLYVSLPPVEFFSLFITSKFCSSPLVLWECYKISEWRNVRTNLVLVSERMQILAKVKRVCFVKPDNNPLNNRVWILVLNRAAVLTRNY